MFIELPFWYYFALGNKKYTSCQIYCEAGSAGITFTFTISMYMASTRNVKYFIESLILVLGYYTYFYILCYINAAYNIQECVFNSITL